MTRGGRASVRECQQVCHEGLKIGMLTFCVAGGAASWLISGDGSHQFNCLACSCPVPLCCGFMVLMRRTATSPCWTWSWRWWSPHCLSLTTWCIQCCFLYVAGQLYACTLKTRQGQNYGLWAKLCFLIHLVELGDILIASESWKSCIFFPFWVVSIKSKISLKGLPVVMNVFLFYLTYTFDIFSFYEVVHQTLPPSAPALTPSSNFRTHLIACVRHYLGPSDDNEPPRLLLLCCCQVYCWNAQNILLRC